MRAQMCPDVYFGDNNSGARRRLLSLSLSTYLVQTFTNLNRHKSYETNASKRLSLIPFRNAILKLPKARFPFRYDVENDDLCAVIMGTIVFVVILNS